MNRRQYCQDSIATFDPTGWLSDLQESEIVDRLFFAGEATSAQHPSTVHGVFFSGEREANRIAQ
jgi:hypothetical protein